METRRTFLAGAAFGAIGLPGAARAQEILRFQTGLGEGGTFQRSDEVRTLGFPARVTTFQRGAQMTELAEKIKSVYWNPEEHGVLIVVAPAMQQVNGRYEQAAALEPTQGKYRPGDLATAFHRQLARFGNVTALIPETMKILRPPSDDDIETMDAYQIQQEFYASLTPAQWKAIGSPDGLSGNNLNTRQRALFLGMLPDPIEIRADDAPLEARPVVSLRGAERARVALRMTQRINLAFMPEGSNGNSSVSFGEGVVSPQTGPKYQMVIGERQRDNNGIAPLVPNQPKPSDIDLTRLEGAVSLAGDSLTLGELVDRCAKACRVEIYADTRMGELPVFVRGDSARVSDLLTAIARSVTGAFRRVSDGSGTAFVLTDDRIGLGQRQSILFSARMMRDMKRMMAQRDAPASDFDPTAVIPLDANSGLSADDQRRLLPQISDQQMRGRKPDEPGGFAVRDLPPALQEQARATLEKNPTFVMASETGANAAPTKLRSDRVLVNLQQRSELVVARGIAVPYNRAMGLGGLRRGRFPVPEPPAPDTTPIVWPKAWRTRAAVVAPPKDRAGWETLFAALAKARIGTVLVEVDTSPEARAILPTAIAAGKKHKLAVGASVRLWTTPKDAPAPAPADLNLFGETSDIGRDRENALLAGFSSLTVPPKPKPETRRAFVPEPAVTQALADEIAALASTPGLSTVLIEDAFPDGYSGDGDGLSRSSSRVALGFTPKNRLAFLRKHRIDPIDLPASDGMNSNYELPFLPSRNAMNVGFRISLDGAPLPQAVVPNPSRLWNEYLSAQALDGRKALRKTVAARSPSVALFVQPGRSAGFVTSWENEAIGPPTYRPGEINPSIAARRLGKVNLRRIEPEDTRYLLPKSGAPGEEPLATLLRFTIKNEAKDGALTWDGVLLDLSNTPPSEIPAVLAAVPSP